MKFPFIGPSYTTRSRNFDCQRSVNLYPVKSEVGDSKAIAGLQSVPGYIEFSTLPTSPIRGEHEVNGRAFAVGGGVLYEVFSNGSYTPRGNLITLIGAVSIDDNGRQICIVDGNNGYIFDITTNTFTVITDPYFTGADTVTFIDGYFMFNRPDSGVYYISALYDGLTGDPLDFATAEAIPDNLLAVKTIHKEVWLFGTQSVQVVYNSGEALFPFSPNSGGFMEYGCAAPLSVTRNANTIFWLGQDSQGSGVVWMATGYQPQRISTFAIEYAIQQYPNINDAIGYAYQEDGHYFYVLSFPAADTTWTFDVTLGLWHERAYWSVPEAKYERHRGQTHMYAFGKHLIGDYVDGKIYHQSLNFYTFNGDVIRRMRTAPHIADDLNYIYYKSFQLDIETGVGLPSGASQDVDPQCMLQWSDDGGHVFKDEHWRSMGRAGEYSKRVIWRMLGRSRDRVYRCIITAACKVFIIQAILNVEKGKN